MISYQDNWELLFLPQANLKPKWVLSTVICGFWFLIKS